MSLKAYIWGICMLTLLSLSAFVAVIRFVDPDNSGAVGRVLFYLSAFFFLSGFFNLLLLQLRKKNVNAENSFSNISLSFRQGILLAIFSVGILILQSFRVLIWWDGLLLMFGIFIIELYFVSRE
jgi:hypothetical protein